MNFQMFQKHCLKEIELIIKYRIIIKNSHPAYVTNTGVVAIQSQDFSLQLRYKGFYKLDEIFFPLDEIEIQKFFPLGTTW